MLTLRSMSTLLPALLVLWSAVSSAYAAESNSISRGDDLLVRGGLPKDTTPSKQNFDWLSLLSGTPRHSDIPVYLVSSAHVGELVPSDFIASVASSGADQPAVLEKGLAEMAYITGLIFMAALVCWMYHDRGNRVVLGVLCYMFSLSSMTLTIRNVYVNFNFNHPVWLTASHFLFTALIGLCILAQQQYIGGEPISVPHFSQFAKGIFPVSAIFAFSIGTANLGLLYTNAHFYEMIGATTALATAGLGLLMGKSFDSLLVPPLLLVTSGLMICAFGELVFSAIGFLFCAMAVTSRALKAIVQHQLMDGEIGSRLTPFQLVVWMSFPSFGIMAVWSMYSEGMQPYYDFSCCHETRVAVMLTVMNACILNISALYVLQNLGPVAQQLAGNLKGILSILGSVFLFSEQVTVQQVVGFSILVTGVTWYNHRDMQIKQWRGGSADAPRVCKNVPGKADESSPLVARPFVQGAVRS